MTHILITHLGKPRLPQGVKDGPEQVRDYEKAIYSLNGNTFETPMIGFGLIEQVKPDRVVILGTTASAWSSAVGVCMNREICPIDDESAWALMYELLPLEKADAMTAEMLDKLSAFLTRWLKLPVTCQQVPYVEDSSRQDTARYLKALDAVIVPESRLSIDVTHGLRYHPMLALVAAQYFASIRKTQLEAIYYGAFDRQREGVAPVLRLDGMLEVLNWVQALNSFDKDGDYGVFASLLKQDTVPDIVCNAMTRAAFFERVTNVAQARQQLTPLRQHAFDESAEPLAELFAPALRERTDWVSVIGRGNAEMKLADEYLARNDYLRAAIYAQEGYISKCIERDRGNPNDFDQRDEVSKTIT
ncbi:TIGR02221 family CRISPR-associated protein [Halomonas sp. 15WGF]|uniref:TIGR02221 family CRISPR-associated protein n=1 Tax=Halomonas sp. 15WGF TaxID=2570357 RepID=UPI0010BE835D|nr:TIGR02221 family CRISPR-associated protein [Halomonas sp. 15WGF]TKJ09315.1 TIGR02221 family CRISPR-associated protein [Halomonas sp. 15WGF]